MKNFVFISPNFPLNYWKFCAGLKKNGMRVLGVGDCPYDDLLPQLKASLDEYYKVGSMENYDEVYRAVAFFAFKYGKIDYLESNNEYWLERDAALREDFHITTGFQPSDMHRIKFKSGMKEYYQKAGVKTARYHLVDDEGGCKKFIETVGYPVIVKPDNGVGAAHTYKLSSDEELLSFLQEYPKDVPYIMEEFVRAEVCSYDAVIDENGEPVFETGNVTPNSIMDIVNTGDNSIYYIVKDLSDDVRSAGRRTVKAFGVKKRFVHFEFFRLTDDQEPYGKKGDVMALEVNMRPCGGYSPDMMNYANSTDVYQIWADMICDKKEEKKDAPHYFCAYAGRRDGKTFTLSHEDVLDTYAREMRMVERIPDALAGAMGNQMYVAVFSTKEEMDAFYKTVLG
ncbi:MAG: ATP-grasp domain-containing protein [Clostridia bacterium]|nr:ATP-grasp domain-containing protein [Clostridia bacterium]